MTHYRSLLLAAALTIVLAVTPAGIAAAAPVRVAPGTAPAAAFPSAQTCNCHSNFLQEWRQSMHAKALADPLFKSKLADATKAGGAPLAAFCVKCHGPVATMVGAAAAKDPHSAAGEGISCTFCHQVTGSSAPSNNVSLLVDPSGVYRAQITNPSAPHPVAVSPFHATSAICGGCHNVSHPGNGLPIETTYSEWQASPQGKAGVTCQDCHMSASPGQTGPSMGWDAGGGPQRPVYQMTFAGAQVALGNSVLNRGMLQSAATLDLNVPGILGGTKNTSATVTVTNVGAGHYLPTGLTEVREMWLEVTFVALDGKETLLGKHQFGTVLKDAAGKYPVEFWNATAIKSDDRIPPGGSKVYGYKFAFPGTNTAGHIRAQLLYRSTSDESAKKAGVDNPVTVMAEQTKPIYSTLDAERNANGVFLAAAAQAPLTPLVISIGGILLCFGIVIFFIWWGKKTTPAPKPRTSGTGDGSTGGAGGAQPESGMSGSSGPSASAEPQAPQD